jgi:hypothetical protein
MPRRNDISKVLVVMLALTLGTADCLGCNWAIGYFHQVRTLKGHVVGRPSRSFFNIRLLRQRFDLSDAEMRLYQYTLPYVDRPPVKVVRADSRGRFDFGSVPQGHYVLEIKQSEWHDAFEVELTSAVPETANILIDISPVRPDCRGGHEFNIQTVAKK